MKTRQVAALVGGVLALAGGDAGARSENTVGPVLTRGPPVLKGRVEGSIQLGEPVSLDGNAVVTGAFFNANTTAAPPVKPQLRVGPDAVPEGLAGQDLSSIRGAYEASRHAAFPVEGGHRARNPGQQWLAKWDGRGVTTQPDAGGWKWGLELRSYGFEGSEHAISGKPDVQVAGQRVTYAWDAAVQEWFVNDQGGLEHGFTVKERPEGIHAPNSQPSIAPSAAAPAPSPQASTLNFCLAVRGGLRPEITADGHGVRFLNAQGAAMVTYTGLKVWDADGKTLPAQFVPSDAGLRLTVDERGARYPLTIDPTAQQAYLKASNTEAGDFFGISVAISGDTVVVGAREEDSNATGVNGDQSDNNRSNSGAAYVFVRSGTTWTQQAYLKASYSGPVDPRGGDNFGTSVAVSGDTVVVGAPNEGFNANTGAGGGAAYVFTRIGTTWTQQAYLKASIAEYDDLFGNSVAVSGETVVVGAQQEKSGATGVNGNQADNSAADAGAAYVFTRSGTTWTQQAYLKASNTGSGDGFGVAVSVSGDTVVVGAPGEDSSATGINGNQADNGAPPGSGAAYVFTRSGSSWTQQAYLKASNTGTGDGFGVSVAASGDTVVIGAIGEDSSATGINGNQADNGAPGSGAAYVFTRSGTSWTQQAYLKASNTGTGDRFGISVAASGEAVVIGADLEDSRAPGINGIQGDNTAGESGAAYIFTRSGATWTQQSYVKASNIGEVDNFGASVAVSGDTAVIGAAHEGSGATGINGNEADNSASDSGAAYVFGGLLPIITVSGNGNTIADGDASAHAITDTYFGGTSVIHGPVVTHSFNITNDGTGNLELGPVIITGPEASDFSVTAAPAASIAPGFSTTFQIAFTASARGPRNATVSFATNDPSRNPFDFAIQGIGRSSNADLSGLKLSGGALSPAFAPATTNYTASVRFNGSSITPTASEFGTIQVRVNGSAYTSVASGASSGALPLNVGANTVDVLVTSEDGRILKTYTVTVTRAPIAPSDVEPGFRVVGNSHEVWTVALQTDGKIVIGGYFNPFGLGGFPRTYLARFFADGTLDTSFTADPTNNSPFIVGVFGAAVQADGKIIFGGFFNSLGGAAFTNIARLNANSTPDTSFNPFLDYIVHNAHLQADGKVVIGGRFRSLGGSPRDYHERLLPGGTLDAAYDANVNNVVLSMAVQTDGQIVIAGQFDTVGGVTRHRVARLNAIGTLDTGFADPFPAGFPFSIPCVAVQADGKVLVGGADLIARFNADGTPDTAFNSNVGIVGGGGEVRSMVVQADGKIIAGGSFTTVGGVARTYVARLNANGTLDAPFNPNVTNDNPSLTNNNSAVRAIAQRGDGKILVGGGFTDIDGVARNGIALLHNDAATQSLGATSSSRVQWLRGGSAPETHMVTFELSTDGGTVFTPLGAGTRISGGWEITGLGLPASGHIRARARITGAFYNGSSSLVETVEGFGPNPNDRDNDGLLDSWEQTYWPGTTGHSALDDFDNDGYSELLELALGLNPTQPNVGGLPPFTTEGGFLTMTITKHAGVTYEVQSAGTLMPGQPDSFSAASTTVLINDATTLKVRDNFLLGPSPPSRFMRVKVTAAP